MVGWHHRLNRSEFGRELVMDREAWRSAKELMLLNYVIGEDSCKSLGLQGDPTSLS